MKDSFILYTKYIKQIKRLNMEQRGLLFTAILMHEAHGDDVLPELDAVTQIAFDFICEDLEENTRKYLDRCAVNSANGSKGGRPKKQKTEKTERFSENRTEAKKADNDMNNDNDLKEKDILTDIQKESPAKAEPLMVAVREIIGYLNEKAGKNYRASAKATSDLVKARMNDGYTIDDFKTVIDVKTAEWKGTEQEKYIRPETLFSRGHFESYLNQPMPKPSEKVRQFNNYDKNMMRRSDAESRELEKRIIAMQIGG